MVTCYVTLKKVYRPKKLLFNTSQETAWSLYHMEFSILYSIWCTTKVCYIIYERYISYNIKVYTQTNMVYRCMLNMTYNEVIETSSKQSVFSTCEKLCKIISCCTVPPPQAPTSATSRLQQERQSQGWLGASTLYSRSTKTQNGLESLWDMQTAWSAFKWLAQMSVPQCCTLTGPSTFPILLVYFEFASCMICCMICYIVC